MTSEAIVTATTPSPLPPAIDNPHKFVNLWQSPEERSEKYWLARSLGANSSWANRLRDWRLSKIERFFNLPEYSLRTEETET